MSEESLWKRHQQSFILIAYSVATCLIIVGITRASWYSGFAVACIVIITIYWIYKTTKARNQRDTVNRIALDQSPPSVVIPLSERSDSSATHLNVQSHSRNPECRSIPTSHRTALLVPPTTTHGGLTPPPSYEEAVAGFDFKV